jgi:hypothetical protein
MRIRKTLKTFLYGSKGRVDIDRVDALREGYRIFTSTSFQAASGKAFQELQFSTSPVAPTPAVPSPPPTPRNGPAARKSARTAPGTPQLQFASHTAGAVMGLGMVGGPAVFTTGTGAISGGGVGVAELDPTVSAAAKVLFSPQGNFVQELVLEEAVNIADALSRSIVSSAIASVTQNPVAVGSLLMRNAIVGGTAAILPPVLKPVSTGLKNLKPFFPLSLAVQELEGVFHLRDEDIESLRILKRLIQMLAGVDPDSLIAKGAGKGKATAAAFLTSPGGAPGQDRQISAAGLIDAEDLALVQQVLVQFSSSVKPGQWPGQAMQMMAPGAAKEGSESESLRAQMRQLLPLIRDSVPGATTLAIRFGRRLVGRSLNRLAERIEGVNHQFLLTNEDEGEDAEEGSSAKPAAPPAPKKQNKRTNKK